ncbi:MAG: hypothetical protein HYW69_01830 [Candidatus Nealsonbacteria bacterium]|nr:hypothetical protein [Candidatus Nealsonbacteria bacterium]
MPRIMIVPGSMGAAKQAIGLFGIERVEIGTWMTPVWVNDLSEDEIVFAEEFFAEYGITIKRENPSR